MAIFDPVHDPGSNFPELLRRVGLGTPAVAPGGDLSVPHGTTCVALRFADGVAMAGDRRGARGGGGWAGGRGSACVALGLADGVVMAGDRRPTAGNLLSHRSMEKVVQADHFSGVAI